jgi:hypothetical protein
VTTYASQNNNGCKQNIMNHTHPLRWLLIECLFENILGIFWTKLFYKIF